MPKPTPPNPYRDLSLAELWKAMQSRGGQLLADAPVGRRDTAYMLLAAADVVHPHTRLPDSPANQVKAGTPTAVAYWELYQAQARALRHNVLIHAADAIGMHADKRKLVTNDTWNRASDLALRDDAGLQEALTILDASRRR